MYADAHLLPDTVAIIEATAALLASLYEVPALADAGTSRISSEPTLNADPASVKDTPFVKVSELGSIVAEAELAVTVEVPVTVTVTAPS